MIASMKTKPNLRLLVNLGEPAGVGYDIAIQLANQKQNLEWIAIGCKQTLLQRATQLGQSIQIVDWHDTPIITPNRLQEIKLISTPCTQTVIPGKLNPRHASTVLDSLQIAHELLIQKKADAILTLPVHKGILNEAGFAFSGHTEWFRDLCKIPMTVMLFAFQEFKIALASTHLPLKQVPDYLTQKKLSQVFNCLLPELKLKWHIQNPRIGVCGLNPHAGENGYLGREEIDIIEPVIRQFQSNQHRIEGCFSADTLLTPDGLAQFDCVLAMYHDQALPVVKFASFGKAVNITLGLPYWRISVDHGTALDKAGTGLARADSAQAAIDFLVQHDSAASHLVYH